MPIAVAMPVATVPIKTPSSQVTDPAGRFTGRLVSLDVLRALAVFLVIARHIGAAHTELPSPLRAVAAALYQAGWIGVDLFFVLSGFLIGGLLLGEHAHTGQIRIGRFLVRRGFKIYPPFFAFLGLSVFIEWWWLGVVPAIVDDAAVAGTRQLWPELVFLQNYFWGWWNHTWSLAVEEHFYILLPLVLSVLAWWTRSRRGGERGGDGKQQRLPVRSSRDDRPFRYLPAAFVCVLVGTLAARIDVVLRWPIEVPNMPPAFGMLHHLTPTHMRIDSLFVGVMLAYLLRHHRGRLLTIGERWRWAILTTAIAGISTAFIMPVQSTFMVVAGFPILAFSFAGVIWLTLVHDRRGLDAFADPSVARSAATAGRSRIGTWSVAMAVVGIAAFIGRHSYSIYLWHMPARNWGQRLLVDWFGVERASLQMYLLTWVSATICAVVLGVIAARVIEFPALRIRDAMYPSRSQRRARLAGASR